MARLSARMSTQPTLPSLVRTRLQSSTGTGPAGFCSGLGACDLIPSDSSFGMESSNQLLGGLGAGGAGGGAVFGWDDRSFDFRRGVLGCGAATRAVTWAACARGESLCPMTSTRAVSGICQKLGETRLGSVCMFKGSKTVAAPCDGYCDALSAMR